MRVVGRYFAIGGGLGSIGGLVALVLIWTWMTVHLGLFGFLIGWVPAGLIAAAVWLVTVLFWGPILVAGAMISMALLLLGGHARHDRAWDEPSRQPRESDETPAADDSPREPAPPIEREAITPPLSAPLSAAPPLDQLPAPPPASVTPPAPHLHPHPTDDLSGDAAAAGDTSRPRPR